MKRFTLEPQGPFSLEMIRTFGCGLMSASRSCSADPDEVAFAFPLDGTFEAVGVRLRKRGQVIEGEAVGASDLEAIRRQVARLLSVDHDGRAFAAMVKSDPVLRHAASAHPGFRPPIFYSPYAAAGWLVLTQRLRQTQAAKLQAEIARAGGDVVRVDGEELASFPRPETLLRWSRFPGVPDDKWARLQSVARAALERKLDVDRLQSLPYAQAHAELMTIHGIGPWTADGILMRGTGLRDAMIVTEPQVHQAVALAYGLDEVPTDEELMEIAERWRPYRAWVSVLLTMQYYRETGGRAPVDNERGRASGAKRQRRLGPVRSEHSAGR